MEDKQLERVKLATLSMQRYNWEQGVVAQAFLEAGDMDTAVLMAVEGVNRQLPDGRCSAIGGQGAVTDPCAIGEALITACENTQDERLMEANRQMLTWALEKAPRNAKGIVYHLCDAAEFWVDSFYMLPPYLARAGRYDEALRQIDGYWHALFDETKGLLSHRWDDAAGQFVREDAWGVGNGWAVAGMARVIRMLPEGYDTSRALLIERVNTVLRAALKYMRTDGTFHDVLDDPSTFVEVNAAQMFAYTIYSGAKEGWLQDDLIDAAETMYHAAQSKIDQYGLVREVCGVPSFDLPHVAPEGQAFCMLMEAARRKWKNQGRSMK